MKPNDNETVQAIDLDPFQVAVNESAARVRGLWLGYIALLAYLLISVAAVTHRDLLLENPVNLPVLQVKLPLVGFFAVAPIFFLINHFFLLLQLFGLGQRLREFNDEITKTDLDEAARRQLRRKLDTFVIVQMLAGPKRDREQVTGMFQRVIAIITLVIAPIMLLLFIQLQFLPYQYELITWMHRLILAIDLGLLWMFWPSIKLGDWAPWRGKRLPNWRGRAYWWDYIVSWRRCCVSWWQTLAIMVVMLFACTIATFPGEIADGGIQAQGWSKPDDSNFPWLKNRLFGDLSPAEIRNRLIPFSRAIDLADDKTLIDLDSFDKINRRHQDNNDGLKPWQTGRTLSLRNRNLRGAMFDRADLRNVDLFAASLQGASLNYASLQGASFIEADLQDAWLNGAWLQGASLDKASLQGASVSVTNLQGASLEYANLQGALLFGSSLQGASLNRASFQGASLDYTNFQGASLIEARFHGASFEDTKLQGATLIGAGLQGVTLKGVNFQGASLEGAGLQGARIERAHLNGASLLHTFLWRVKGVPSSFQGAWVKAPELSALSAGELAALEQESLEGVTSEVLKKRIKRIFARLVEPEKDGVNNSESFWANLEDKVSEVEHQEILAGLFETQICGGKATSVYVAQGLIRRRLEHIGRDHLPGLARKLLDSAEGRTIDCPGLEGLNAESTAKLRQWAAESRVEDK